MQGLLLILSVLFILLSSFFCALTQAQIFNLGLDKGLSNNSVKCVFQDSKGYVWFGTFDGLNRYDGYEIRSYRNKLNDSGSLPHNYIYCIAEDRFQKLWIGTGQGVGIYDGNFDSFSRLRFHPHWDTNDTQVLNADAKTIQVDLDNNIYVGTNGWGLFVKNAQNNVADWIPLREKNKEDSYYYHAAVVYIDPTQHIWVFINGEGLFQYNKKTKSLSLVNDRVLTAQCMISDKHGNLFLGNT